MDQYYVGGAKDVTGGNVASIITASVRELLADPNRRFSYVEQVCALAERVRSGVRAPLYLRNAARTC